MTAVFIIILLILVVVITARLCVNLWHAKPDQPINTKEIGIMVGYIVVLIGCSIAIIKFL
jgi:hypothetical protein